MGYDWDIFGGNIVPRAAEWDIFGTLLGYPWGMLYLIKQLPQLLGYGNASVMSDRAHVGVVPLI